MSILHNNLVIEISNDIRIQIDESQYRVKETLGVSSLRNQNEHTLAMIVDNNPEMLRQFMALDNFERLITMLHCGIKLSSLVKAHLNGCFSINAHNGKAILKQQIYWSQYEIDFTEIMSTLFSTRHNFIVAVETVEFACRLQLYTGDYSFLKDQLDLWLYDIATFWKKFDRHYRIEELQPDFFSWVDEQTPLSRANAALSIIVRDQAESYDFSLSPRYITDTLIRFLDSVMYHKTYRDDLNYLWSQYLIPSTDPLVRSRVADEYLTYYKHDLSATELYALCKDLALDCVTHELANSTSSKIYTLLRKRDKLR